jgi:hypothetical protein
MPTTRPEIPAKDIDTKKEKKNLTRFHIDAGTSAVEDAAINYQSPSIIAAGANAQSVSILATLVNLSLSLICIKAPSLIERIGLTKRGAVILSFANTLAWIPLILAFLLGNLGITPMWLALLWLINVMPAILLSFQKDNWLSNVVPSSSLGRYLGQRLAIKSAFYLVAFIVLGYLLDAFKDGSLIGFAFIFILALIMSTADFITFTHMHEKKTTPDGPPAPVIPQVKFGIFDFVKELKVQKLSTFMVFNACFYLTVGLSGPLFAVYMLEEKQFTYLSFTLIIAAEYLARVISGPFWGKYADKAGNIKVLSIVARIIPALPILWLFSSNIGYLALVQTLSGVCWGAFDLSTQSYLYKVAPPEKKLRYIVYTRCLILFSTAMGGLAGAYMVKGIFTTFGSQMLSVFMISGFFRAIVVMYLIPKLVDLAVVYGNTKTTLWNFSLDSEGKRKLTTHGLFYHQPEAEAVAAVTVREGKKKAVAKDIEDAPKRHWAKVDVKAAKLIAAVKDQEAAAQRQWATDNRLARFKVAKEELAALTNMATQAPEIKRLRILAAQPVAVKEPEKPALSPTRRAWYKDEEITTAYIQRARPVLLNDNKPAVSKDGMYYNSTNWSNYLRQTMQTAMQEKQQLVAVQARREQLFQREPPKVVTPRLETPRMEIPRLNRIPVYVRG